MVNTSKTVALPSKGHAPTAEEISLLESVDVRVADEGEVTVVGVLIGTDEYVLERAREIVMEGGTDHLEHYPANMPDKQAAALIVIESLGQRTGYPRKGSRHGAVPRSMQEGKQRGAVSI